MAFALVCVGLLAVLAIVAAVASRFDKGSDEIVQAADDCAACTEDCQLRDVKRKCKDKLALLLIAAMLLFTGCSTKKNTGGTRFWHSFNARYNTYFNGSQAFIDGNLEKEKGNRDNYTEMIPLYAVGNKQSRELGKGQFDRTIEKCEKTIRMHSIKAKPQWSGNRRKTARDREWLSRKEYNPFIWRAWLLLGKAQFQEGAFEEAAATFSYMSRLYQTQPLQSGLARAWLAKSYTELGWMYDAEDVIRNMNRDSVHYRTVKDWDYTYADYYIRRGDYEKAVPYLKKVIKHERRSAQRAREWYLMGQLQAQLGNRQEAYRAYRKVVGCHPPYELEFNARIAQTEVMAQGNARQMIGKLRRMAASDNNAEYLDQVYYAIGNIYLKQNDTLKAIGAYEKGNEKSVRNGIEKGVLLLTLGNLYWEREKFSDAQRCYGEAIGLLDKERPDYESLAQRSRILDELVPHTEAIHLQDSLLELSVMLEAGRLAAIDRVIEALKKKEKEERDRQLEAEAEQQQNLASASRNRNSAPATPAVPAATSGQWYFYNPMAVSQGKATFIQQWGRRENKDNWQRINQTVVSIATHDEQDDQDDTANPEEETMDAVADSLRSAPDAPDDSTALDPHNREYYLAQIPFTDEQKAASHAIIQEALFHAGIIFKDKLDNLNLSEQHLLRLTGQYPDYERSDEAWYHLFLLYARREDMTQADSCLARMQRHYPESEWTILIADPFYATNARFGEHIEDSLYAATYLAFKEGRYDHVKANTLLSTERFPQGENRPKFVFIEGLSLLNDGDGDGCVARLKEVVEKYPDSEVSELAGMIIKGVGEGRPLHGGHFDIGDVWTRRDAVLMTDSARQDTLNADRDQNFLFVLAFEPDSVNENQLLFEMARYNFTNFLVRNFDMQIESAEQLHRMLVSGFMNYDEALQYARQLYASPAMAEQLKQCRSLIVSEKNLPLLGTRFSYDDYQQFYEDTFIPMKVSDEQLLNLPESIEQIDPEDIGEPQPAQTGNEDDEEEDDDFLMPGGNWRQQQVEDIDFGDGFW